MRAGLYDFDVKRAPALMCIPEYNIVHRVENRMDYYEEKYVKQDTKRLINRSQKMN